MIVTIVLSSFKQFYIIFGWQQNLEILNISQVSNGVEFFSDGILFKFALISVPKNSHFSVLQIFCGLELISLATLMD